MKYIIRFIAFIAMCIYIYIICVFGYIVWLCLDAIWHFKFRTLVYIKKDIKGWQEVRWDSYWGYDSGGNYNYYSSYYNNVLDFLMNKDLQKPHQYRYTK